MLYHILQSVLVIRWCHVALVDQTHGTRTMAPGQWQRSRLKRVSDGVSCEQTLVLVTKAVQASYNKAVQASTNIAARL